MLLKTITWADLLVKFSDYLRYERNMSDNTIESYIHDAELFVEYAQSSGIDGAQDVTKSDVSIFMTWLYDRGVSKSSQARILSGVKSLFNYLMIEGVVESTPLEFIEAPKLSRELPDVLTVEEVEAMMNSIDLSGVSGHRDRAILETMYGSGLRVSELLAVQLGDIFAEEEILRVMGKGRKQRLVPISEEALKHIKYYMEDRAMMKIDPKHKEYLFLNKFGRKLSRMTILTIVHKAAEDSSITKSVTPHTLRHSFATHLLEGGASIAHVQMLLGHESITTTELYTHLDRKRLKESLENHHPEGIGFRDSE